MLDSSRPVPPPSPTDLSSITLSRRMAAIVLASLILPWVALFAVLRLVLPAPGPVPAERSVPSPPQNNAEAPPASVNVGPWGQLELTTVIIEPPDDLITVDAERVDGVKWHFVGYSRADVEALFQRSSLGSEQLEELLAADKWAEESDRITVLVGKPLVIGLSPDSRQVLYAALSPFRENAGQWSPASFRAESAADWFSNSGLTEHTLSLVQPLLYRRGNSLLFSDLALILADIKSQRQRLLLMRTLARSTTQLARLRLNVQTDVPTVAAYWSLGQRSRDIEPLIKSVVQSEDDFGLDIIHLLPGVARRLLYTYDSPPPPGQEPFRDCHWTALNFGNREIDDRYRHLDEVRSAYQNNFVPVTDAPQLGDIYLFVTEGEIVLHACVHIAGDLVFTKNGSWAAAPWVLMRMPDLLALYPSQEPMDVRHLRPRR